MPTEAFISYAHVDDRRRERLHKHLAMLNREKLISVWSDHEILAGDRFADKIDEALEQAGLFIALLSPDYLASNYCYEKEFQRALQLNEAGQLRIVGVVVEPCDWRSSPFADLVVLPKSGKAIPDWANENTAYLNVVEELRRVLKQPPAPSPAAAESTGQPHTAQARRYRVKQDFDAIQRAEFGESAFQTIGDYFRRACSEMHEASEHLRARFSDLGRDAFTCTLVNRAKIRGGEAHVTIRRGRGRHHVGDISWLWAEHGEEGTSNGWLSVEADDFELHLKGSIDRFGFGGRDQVMTSQQAAEQLWNAFMEQAGIQLAE